MANEVLLNGTSCATPLTTGPNGYYLGVKNGVPTWVPLITSRTLTVTTPTNSGVNVEMGALNDLTDVDTATTAPTNGQVLTYNSTTGQWEPKSAATQPLAQISQTNAPFSANTAGQIFNIPAVPILTPNNTTGILTFQPGDGTTVTIDICALVAACNLDARVTSGNGAPTAAAGDPIVYTDLLTRIVYYRDVAGTVTIIDTPVPDISDGAGLPPFVTNQPTFWTDLNNGNIYYRAPDGSTLLFASGSAIPVTSGAGAPATTASSPVVYTDTSNGDIYYRDSTGVIVKIFSRPTPVAAYELTVKDATNRVWTFDGASSTSTDNGVTIATYAWTITPVGASGVATIATPAASSTTVTFPATGSWLLTLTVTDSNGNTKTVTKLIEVDDTVLVAAYETTSKIGLTAAFDGTSSVGAVTYAWTAVAINGTTATAAFGTPAASTTTVTFSDEGEWQIILTVTSASGQTKTVTKDIAAARILHVNGASVDVNGQHFLSLQLAFNWITANDAANAAKYTIFILGTTTDATRIVPNTAQVHFEPFGRINVGVDFPAGIYRWSGELIRNNFNNGIQNAAGDTITCSVGTILVFEGVNINALDATAYAVSGTSYIAVFNNVQLFSSGGGILQTAAPGSFNFIHCSMDVRGNLLSCLDLTSAVVVAEHSRFSHTQGITMSLTATSGRIFNCDIVSNRSAVAGEIAAAIDIDATALGSTLNIANCVLTVNNPGVAPGFTCGIRIQGSSGFIYISNNSIIVGQYGIVLHTSVGNNSPRLVLHGNFIYGVTSPLIGTSSLVAVVAAALTGLRMYNCTMQGVPNALITYAAGVASGANISSA